MGKNKRFFIERVEQAIAEAKQRDKDHAREEKIAAIRAKSKLRRRPKARQEWE